MMYDPPRPLKRMFRRSQQHASSPPDQILSSLPDPFRSALLSMYAGEPQLGEDGQKYALDGTTNISPEEGMWLYEFCKKVRPRATLEIGLAYGFSTIYFLAAIAEDDNARHCAIDPYQRRAGRWAGIGLVQWAAFRRRQISFYRRAFLFGAGSSCRRVRALRDCLRGRTSSVRFGAGRLHSERGTLLHGRIHHSGRYVAAIHSARCGIHPNESNGLHRN